MTNQQLIDREGLNDAKCREIAADAIRFGLLTHMCSGGCGKTSADCGGCPCGSYLGWHPDVLKAICQKEQL